MQVDPRQWRRQLPQVGGRCADDAGQLAEGPMRGRDRFIRFRQDQVQSFGAITRGLDRMSAVCTTRLRLRSERPFTLAQRSSSDRYRSSSGRLNHSDDTRPFRSPGSHPLSSHPTAPVRPDPELPQRPSAISRDGRREPLSQPSTRHRETGTPLALQLERERQQCGTKRPHPEVERSIHLSPKCCMKRSR